jgi:hypothetical protein
MSVSIRGAVVLTTRAALAPVGAPGRRFSAVSPALVPRGRLARLPGTCLAGGRRRPTVVIRAGPQVAARRGDHDLAVVTARPVHDVVRRSGR